jgi:hypothetical protein
MTPTNPSNKNKKILGTIVGFALGYFAVQQIFFKTPPFDEVLMQSASELNKSCPMMVDGETRLDSATVFPGNAFQYNYTLVNLEKEEINPDTIRKYLEPGIINNVKTNRQMKIFRDHKTTIDYSYKDKNGVFVLKMSVTPDKYADRE